MFSINTLASLNTSVKVLDITITSWLDRITKLIHKRAWILFILATNITKSLLCAWSCVYVPSHSKQYNPDIGIAITFFFFLQKKVRTEKLSCPMSSHLTLELRFLITLPQNSIHLIPWKLFPKITLLLKHSRLLLNTIFKSYECVLAEHPSSKLNNSPIIFQL